MIILFGAAFAAAPTSEAQVDTLLQRLLAESADDRIAAANALARTPPELVRHLDSARIDPTCAEQVAQGEVVGLVGACQRWNHAMYHYVRIVGALARNSVDPRTELGRWCLARTQPHAGSPVREPACPLVSRLRWLINDPFDQVDFLVVDPDTPPPFEIPEAVSAAALTEVARTAYRTALTPEIDATTVASYPSWSAQQEGRRFTVVPICGGQPGFHETCAFHLVIQEGKRFDRTVLLPATDLSGSSDPGLPYANVRMTEGVQVSLQGDHAVVVTDGGGGDDHTRRYTVYDVRSAPRLHCTLERQLADAGAAPPVQALEIRDDGCTLPM